MKAHAHAMIMRLADDYGTRIGVDGVRLSGGQVQQIALARAFFGDPAILLLDEPNASLDPDGRSAFEAAIREARAAKRTVVIVTQRDDVLALVDAVMVIDKGMIADFGPRDEVIRRLAEKQARNGQKPPAAPEKAPPTSPASPFAGLGPGLKPIGAAPVKGGANG